MPDQRVEGIASPRNSACPDTIVRGGRLTAWSTQRGQALIETALVVPLLLTLAFGVIGVGRVTQAQMAVTAVAREAARAEAVADDPQQAQRDGVARGQSVAHGYNLRNGTLQLMVSPGAMQRGEQVVASAQYTVSLADLPLLGWAHVTVQSEDTEPIDLYRARWSAGNA